MFIFAEIFLCIYQNNLNDGWKYIFCEKNVRPVFRRDGLNLQDEMGIIDISLVARWEMERI